MQVAVRDKLEQMIKSRFAPIVALSKLLHTQRREEIRAELEDELGLTAARKELFILTSRAEVINKMIKKLAGNSYAKKDSPINLEIERRLKAEDTVYSRIELALKEQKEAVWLAGASTKMVKTLADLDKKILPKFMKELEAVKRLLLPDGIPGVEKIELPKKEAE